MITPTTNMIVFICWLASSLTLNWRAAASSKLFKIWAVVIAWQFLMLALGHTLNSLNFFIYRIPLAFMPFALIVFLDSYSQKQIKILLTGIMTTFVYNLIDNIRIGILSPELFDYSYLAFADENVAFLNVGSTEFVFVTMLVMIIMFVVYLSVKQLTIKYIALIVALMCTYYIIAINTRGTTFFVGLLTIVSLTIFKIMPTATTKQKIARLLLFAIIFYIVMIPTLSFISDIITNERLQIRIDSVVNALTGGSAANDEGSLTGRIKLIGLSITTFLSSPFTFLFGIGEDSYDVLNVWSSGVGHHSQLVDYLAFYGIVGSFFFYYALKIFIKYVYNLPSNTIVKEYVGIIMTSIIFYAILNNILNFAPMIIIMVFTPLIIKIIDNKLQE